MRRPANSPRHALAPLCLALALALGATTPSALAAAASTTRVTTTPSLTRSFPLGHRRLDRSRSAGSQSARSRPAAAGNTPRPSSSGRSARRAGSTAPGPLVMWILIVLGAIGLTAVVTSWVQRRVTARRAQSTDEVGEAPIAEATGDASPEFGPVKFLLYQDNSGGYYWTIADDSGTVLARSTGFASYPEANFAADIVHRAASSATFENRSGTTPPPRPLARTDGATHRDPAEAEPPSEPGGSVGREEATRQARAARSWPAGSSSTPGGRRR